MPDDPLGLGLEDLGLPGLLDVVLAQPDSQGGHVRAAHTEEEMLTETLMTND